MGREYLVMREMHQKELADKEALEISSQILDDPRWSNIDEKVFQLLAVKEPTEWTKFEWQVYHHLLKERTKKLIPQTTNHLNATNSDDLLNSLHGDPSILAD